MGLSTVLSTSNAGLQAVQAELQWRSDNISNASSTTYGRRDAMTVSVGTNSVTATIQRAADQSLQNQYLNANARSTAAAAQTGYLQQVNDVLGTTQSTPYLQQNLDTFIGAWQSYETDPNNTTSEAYVVSSGQALGQYISTAAASLQNIADETRSKVGATVTELNTNLTKLDAINKALSSNPNASTQMPDLLDNRDSLVAAISSQIGVTQVSHPDGSVALYTKNGTVLIDKTPSQFQWNNPTGGQPWISFAPPSPIGAAPGLDAQLTGGTIGAALDFLNPSTSSTDPNVGALAKAQAQLDIVTSQLTDNVVPAAAVPPAAGTNTFGGAYFTASTDRTTDLLGGPAGSFPVVAAVPATAAGAAPAGTPSNMSSFFIIDNGNPASLSPSQSIQINPALANGTATVKRQSASAVVAALTATTYSLTTNQTGTTVAGSPTITGLSQTSGLKVGMTVSGNGIPQGTTILSVANNNGTTITLSANAAAGAATGLTFGLINPQVSNVTLSGLASAYANYQSGAQSSASVTQTQLTQTTQSLNTRLTGEVGVNMDTEMAQLTILQNAYSANAKVMTTVQAMFTTLLQMGG